MKKDKIAVLGFEYVGLPLAVALAEKYFVTGFDISSRRIKELTSGFDRNRELSGAALNKSSLLFIRNLSDLATSNIYIVTVPTPIYSDHKPDLTFLKQASILVGNYLQKGDMVIFESTVYPGVTEYECLPLSEEHSQLSVITECGLGYIAKRITPSDKDINFTNITKVTSGAKRIDAIYSYVITVGTHLALTTKVAETAKVIENTQRNLNIVLVNQLAQLFAILEIDAKLVLDAAKTKLSFLPFQSGLVGSHYLGVDPYYLYQKSETVGYIPDIILAGGRLNGCV
ncbi:nucleotide sugar dehydrogenase [Planctobacterium marinum]|uniref:nucleotide sugar dehydrogenase n=1 Tax=Planctobacterium marinum TaxID=1631968 RepID=UPI001E5BB916|nr:hypothetical protein [Planctobacterium marinum]MCC2606213.1 hypothetical protein [Planctobacterium marinum]